MFVITLSIDNQWTVEWHTWLPYKTNQFHMQHDFRFSSYRPHSACPGVANNFFSVQSILFNYCLKVLSMKIIWINIRTKNVHQNLCCVGSLLQYILSTLCWYIFILDYPNDVNSMSFTKVQAAALPRKCRSFKKTVFVCLTYNENCLLIKSLLQ